MKAERIIVIAGVRTPFTKAGTSLAQVSAMDLARTAMLGVLVRSAVDPAQIDEVILGCVAQPPEAPNLARVAALRSGIPQHVPAITVQRNCASGVEAITQAWLRIRAGEGELYLVGGVESMSGIPM
ncbi:MAG TPA: beta-ketoacyl synthase N-terminal-like domain-containing protein, partial [Terrimicrobiaceae bacterium]